MSDTTGNYLSHKALPTNSTSTGKKGTTENFQWDGSDRQMDERQKDRSDRKMTCPKEIR